MIQKKKIAYISLGSNVGDAADNLARAVAWLEREAKARGLDISVVKRSDVYLTEPQGYREQPFFANQVIALACGEDISPESLFAFMQEGETALGRVREGLRYGPRVIDLDLLLFGHERRQAPELTLPHPRMLERAFMLVPLADIAPDLELPRGVIVIEALSLLPHTVRGNVIYQDD